MSAQKNPATASSLERDMAYHQFAELIILRSNRAKWPNRGRTLKSSLVKFFLFYISFIRSALNMFSGCLEDATTCSEASVILVKGGL